MDQKVEIKEEPVWLDGTEAASFDNYELASEMTCLQEETKSKFEEPVQTQMNTFEPVADVKDEINIEEQTVAQLVPCLKEESNFENVALLSRGQVYICNSSCRIKKSGSKLTCSLPPQNVLKLHMFSHSGEKPYFPISKQEFCCDHCDKSFSRKSSLRKHLFVHTEVPPHSCNLCGKCLKSFNDKSTFRRHMLVHTAERPYDCRECGKRFSQKKNLRSHMLVHVADRPHCCDVCFKTFSHKHDLRRHLLIHTGERPYSCSICGRGFTQQSAVKKHKLVHTGERPLCCNKCGKRFREHSHLRIHKLRHTGERPFCCDQCGARFLKKSTLRVHMRTHSI